MNDITRKHVEECYEDIKNCLIMPNCYGCKAYPLNAGKCELNLAIYHIERIGFRRFIDTVVKLHKDYNM